MKISRSFVKTISGLGLFVWGFNLMFDGIAETNQEVGYHFGKIDGFSEGCKYARRRGINNENNDNNSNENKD